MGATRDVRRLYTWHMQKRALTESGQADTPITPVPEDWGLPGWSPESFKAFNDARRKVHQLMQGWEKLLLRERTPDRPH